MKEHLFCSQDLSQLLEGRLEEMKEELEAYPADRLLNTSADSLVSYFVEKYGAQPIVLHEDRIEQDQHETRLDVSQDPNRLIMDRGEPFYVAASRFEFFLPFSGDPEILECRPSSYDYNPPRAQVDGSELVFSVVLEKPDGQAAKQQFEHELAKLRKYVSWGAGSVATFNQQFKAKAHEQIEGRRTRLLAGRNEAASLGYPMRMRADAPRTYVSPAVRRRIVAPPKASSGAFAPEPVMSPDDYEHILKVLESMVLVMERSPKTFRNMQEEDIRSHLLVQLNGQYEGSATGETFNGSGKTDILVRVDNRNIFIGECKFWSGPGKFTDAVDQLLGYTSWRDTKTAILLFNRNKDTSKVLAQIPALLGGHSKFKRTENISGETRFRAILHQPGDASREVILTVLVFDVPA